MPCTPWELGPRRDRAALAGPSFAGTAIPKYVQPLVIPPAMPLTGNIRTIGGKRSTTTRSPSASSSSKSCPQGCRDDGLELRLRQPPETFNYPAFTIEAKWKDACPRQMDQSASSTRTATTCRTCCPSTRRCTGRTRPAGRVGRDEDGFDPTPYRGRCRSSPTCTAGTLEPGERRLPRGLVPARGERTSPRATPPSGSYYDTFKAQAEALYGQPWTPGTRRLPVRQRPGGRDPLVPRPHARDDAARTSTPGRRASTSCAAVRATRSAASLPGPAPRSATRRERSTTRSRSRSRTAPSTRTGRSSTRTTGRSLRG